jgi:uncharacterized protein (DUF1697 family)
MTTRTLSIALLRGINVGGKHRVPMADLRELFAQGGFPGARTYIQSGNVVFAGDVAGAARARVAARLAAVAQRTFGFPVPFVLRTARELAAIAGNNPFLAEGEDPSALHVVFASGPISARAARALDPDRSPPDRFRVAGDVVFLHCPNGVARTKLTADWFDTSLGLTTTVRNWRTVLALRELAGAGV